MQFVLIVSTLSNSLHIDFMINFNMNEYAFSTFFIYIFTPVTSRNCIDIYAIYIFNN